MWKDPDRCVRAVARILYFNEEVIDNEPKMTLSTIDDKVKRCLQV